MPSFANDEDDYDNYDQNHKKKQNPNHNSSYQPDVGTKSLGFNGAASGSWETCWGWSGRWWRIVDFQFTKRSTVVGRTMTSVWCNTTSSIFTIRRTNRSWAILSRIITDKKKQIPNLVEMDTFILNSNKLKFLFFYLVWEQLQLPLIKQDPPFKQTKLPQATFHQI